MDFKSLQQIAKGVVECSAACDGQLFTGKVTGASPLKIKLGDEAGGIELDGDDIILTANVVSKKIYIEKHKHEEDEQLIDVSATDSVTSDPINFTPSQIPTTLALKHSHAIHDVVVNGWCTEYGYKLPVDKNNERIVITINRSLEVGDSVIMTRVSHGQQFVVLSRYFEVDKPGEDDGDTQPEPTEDDDESTEE